MPLLPGETRESDRYQSGLGIFFDDGARAVRRWADSTQHSMEGWWRNLESPKLSTMMEWGNQVPTTVARIVEGSGPLAPAVVDLDDPNLWRVMIPAAVAAGSEVYNRGDPLKKCPGTMMLILANAFAFTHRVPVMKWGIRPALIIEQGQVYRLLSAPFVHGDLGHMLSNMASLLRSGYVLEHRRGGWSFLAEAINAIFSAGAFRLAASMFQLHVLRDVGGYYSACAFGFSSAAFALRVVAGDAEAESRTAVSARLRNRWSQFSCWAEVAVTHLVVPRSDLWGHVCGVAAGLLRVHLPREWPEIGAWMEETTRSMLRRGNTLRGSRGLTWQGGGGRLGRGADRVQVGPMLLHPVVVHAALGAAAITLLPAIRKEAFQY